ncbi:MAG TPA: FAD-binding protein [Rubrobacter sp.]|nr:FAD-binding protein [Rubrobacter sp.]
MDRPDGGGQRGRADLDYCRRLVDEVPGTIEFMQKHGAKLVHHDEVHAALDFEDQHYVFLTSGGKEIVDFYLEHINKYEGADVLLGHEAPRLTVDDGRVNGVVVRTPRSEELTIEGDTVVLASGSFGGNRNMLWEHLGRDVTDLPHIAPGIRYNQGGGIRMARGVGADTAGQFDMFHAELVDPRASKYHPAIWGQTYGIVVNENCERFHGEGADYLFARSRRRSPTRPGATRTRSLTSSRTGRSHGPLRGQLDPRTD